MKALERGAAHITIIKAMYVTSITIIRIEKITHSWS